MTIEEAVKILDPETSQDALLQYAGLPAGALMDVMDEAFRTAAAALRAQQTPVKLDRSRWQECHNCQKWMVCGYRNYAPAYCRDCGKPLNEEAWAELERRIGGDDGYQDLS